MNTHKQVELLDVPFKLTPKGVWLDSQSCVLASVPCRSFSTYTVGTAFSSVSRAREPVRGNPGEKKPGSGAGVAGSSEVLAACSGVMGF